MDIQTGVTVLLSQPLSMGLLLVWACASDRRTTALPPASAAAADSDADAGMASAPWPSSTVLRAPYLDVVIALFLELTGLHQAHHALIAVQGIGLDVIELFKL